MTIRSDHDEDAPSRADDRHDHTGVAGPARCIDLQFRDQSQSPDQRFALSVRGFAAEHVVMQGARTYDYDVAENAHYLALHDLKLVEGEISLADAAPRSRLDLRDRLTLTPSGCRATGFASLVDRTNSFTAMTYDPALLAEEVDRPGWGAPTEPMLYFRDTALTATLTKLRDVLITGDESSAAHAETLGLLALFEINGLHTGGSPQRIADSGLLSARQQRLVRDYIADNLPRPLPLTELAAVAGLTRFHFSRAFSRSFGTSPHQFILRARVERAGVLLTTTILPIATIAAQVGFKTPSHLSAAMRAQLDCTPSQYRRSRG